MKPKNEDEEEKFPSTNSIEGEQSYKRICGI